ncbi:MAG: alpha/beta hydrolase [Aquificae bacterium]|nr:alpha/beta hydrolase [Aquificota bacterium]
MDFVYDLNGAKRVFIHLHGLASGVTGSKVSFMRAYFKRKKSFDFYAPQLEYGAHTTTELLELLAALVRGFSERYGEVWLSGSSHGAYAVLNLLRFYELPKVKRALLFAPSYCTLTLIVEHFGRECLEEWLEGRAAFRMVEEAGEVEFRADWAKDVLERGYEIIRDGRVYFPSEPPCELVVVHGKKDEVVPFSLSELFVSKVKVKEFLAPEDDHRLSRSFTKVFEKLVP